MKQVPPATFPGLQKLTCDEINEALNVALQGSGARHDGCAGVWGAELEEYVTDRFE